jgi:hypothetical protein
MKTNVKKTMLIFNKYEVKRCCIFIREILLGSLDLQFLPIFFTVNSYIQKTRLKIYPFIILIFHNNELVSLGLHVLFKLLYKKLF